MLLFAFERTLLPPPDYAASWLHGEGSPRAWTVRMLGLTVEHRVQEEGPGSRLRLEVHAPSRAWVALRPALRLAIRARSARLARQMARDHAAR